MSEPMSQAAIQARAYQLWEESGRMDGAHEEHWRRAEAECAPASDGTDEADGAAMLRGTDGSGDGATARSGADGAPPPAGAVDAAPSSGLDGEIARPLIDVKSKPRRWPTPIIDA